MSLRTRVGDFKNAVVEELQAATGTPEPVSIDSRHSQVARSGDVDQHFPNKTKLERHWDLYTKVPIIRQPIRSFASEVIEPGYYIDSENEDLKEDLEDWLKESSIVDGEIDKDFSRLLKKATIQREVKGTSLVEKVPDGEGGIYGFKLMKPETVRAYTHPGQTVLIAPDAELEDRKTFLNNNNFYTTEDDQIAAYVQLAEDVNPLDSGKYIPFTRNDVIKLTRDSDVGDVFGESRITAVEDRLESLLKKLEDNDKAIESLAHPFQLFQFGDEDNPWSPSEIKNFMGEHDQADFEPGMKQGVQGNVSIETVSGEVAPIETFLDFDLNWIISEMPMPRYALGGFESEVNQFISRSQSARLEKQKKEARQEIQKEWNPVLEEKAEEMGYDSDEFNKLVIGDDPEDLNLVERNQVELPEDSDLPEDEIDDGQDGVGPSGENTTRPPASTEDRDGGPDVVEED